MDTLQQKSKAQESFVELMVEKLEELSSSDGSWKKPWITQNYLPISYNGKRYSSFNSFYLSLICQKNDYKVPVFVTYDKAQKSGFSINKGEHGYLVDFSKIDIKNQENETITYEEYKDLSKDEQELCTIKRYSRTHVCFNLEQTNFKEVFPEKWEKIEKKFTRENHSLHTFSDKAFDHLVEEQKWICPINLKQQDKAYYSPLHNEITVPKKEQFIDQKEFYYTMMHEMAHSTGKGLNRDLTGNFGSELYAKEELIAELTSALSGNKLGYSVTPRKENAQYLKSWLSVLQEEPKYINNLINQVNLATNIITNKIELSKEELQQLDKEREGWTPAERAAINKEIEEINSVEALLQECNNDVKESIIVSVGKISLNLLENINGATYYITESGYKSLSLISKSFNIKDQNVNSLKELITGKPTILKDITGKDMKCELFKVPNGYRIRAKAMESLNSNTNELSI